MYEKMKSHLKWDEMVRRHHLCIMPVRVGKRGKDESRQREEGMVGERSLNGERVSSLAAVCTLGGLGSQQKSWATPAAPGTCPPVARLVGC